MKNLNLLFAAIALASFTSGTTKVEAQGNKSDDIQIESIPFAYPKAGCLVPDGAFLARFRRITPLRLPNSKQARCVAVVEVLPDGKTAINPEVKGLRVRLNYGRIPSLDKISIAQADEFWGGGTQLGSGSIERTYKLKSLSSNADYFFDLSFHDGRIERYRVRSNELRKSHWQLVEM